MAGIRIVTDSTADLPPNIIDDFDIAVVPLKVLFGSETFRDSVDITSAEFFQRLRNSDVLPTTSQPSPGEFAKVYEDILAQGQEIISIHISSQLSGTMHSAMMAKEMLNSDLIEVVDSKSVSLGLGMIVMEAARAAKEGKDKKAVMGLVRELEKNIRIYFLVDTLEYLARGGRIGKAQSLMGSLLNIKPILTFREGIVTPFDRARGRNKAIDRIIESIKEEHGDRTLAVSFVYAADMELFREFHDRIMSSINAEEKLVSQLGPVVGTHGGPGVVAVVAYAI